MTHGQIWLFHNAGRMSLQIITKEWLLLKLPFKILRRLPSKNNLCLCYLLSNNFTNLSSMCNVRSQSITSLLIVLLSSTRKEMQLLSLPSSFFCVCLKIRRRLNSFEHSMPNSLKKKTENKSH